MSCARCGFLCWPGWRGESRCLWCWAPPVRGKSSFLRAGLIPRLQREDRRFVVLGIVRPQRAALTGDHGLAAAIDTANKALQAGWRAAG